LRNLFFLIINQVIVRVIAMFLLSSAFCHAEDFKLALVLSEESGAYLEYSSALKASLSDSQFVLSVIAADQPIPKSDLIIAAGMKAAAVVARSKPAAMLAVLIPKQGLLQLLNEFPDLKDAGKNMYSAIYLDQPSRRQIDLITLLLPATKIIGVLYTEPPSDISALRMQATAHKCKLYERSFDDAKSDTSSPMYTALQELLVSSDVLLALPDVEIYNSSTIRNILLATYRNRVPLIGLSSAYVKAGALAAIYSTPEQIAIQSVGLVRTFAETHMLPPAQYAKDFEVSVNEQVAHSLGLNVKSATQLRAEIGKLP
jgi:putative ABC transport system substrate-binding protein